MNTKETVERALFSPVARGVARDRQASIQITVSLTSSYPVEKAKELLEAYFNDACSKLENEGFEVTYKTKIVDEWDISESCL